jgi:beta-galactosidase
VEVYSRAPKVRLYLNGKLVAERNTTREDSYKAVITVPYEQGELRVEAVDEAGNPIASRNAGGHTVLKTAGKPYALRVKADRSLIAADGQDLSFVTVEVVDRNGTVCPHASDELTFSLKGSAVRLVAAGNGDIKELDTTVDNVHKAWKGRALAVVRSSSAGRTTITVTSPGLKPAKVTVNVK